MFECLGMLFRVVCVRERKLAEEALRSWEQAKVGTTERQKTTGWDAISKWQDLANHFATFPYTRFPSAPCEAFQNNQGLRLAVQYLKFHEGTLKALQHESLSLSLPSQITLESSCPSASKSQT